MWSFFERFLGIASSLIDWPSFARKLIFVRFRKLKATSLKRPCFQQLITSICWRYTVWFLLSTHRSISEKWMNSFFFIFLQDLNFWKMKWQSLNGDNASNYFVILTDFKKYLKKCTLIFCYTLLLRKIPFYDFYQ